MTTLHDWWQRLHLAWYCLRGYSVIYGVSLPATENDYTIRFLRKGRLYDVTGHRPPLEPLPTFTFTIERHDD